MMNESTPPKVELPQQFDFSNGSTNTYLVEARHGLIPNCLQCGQFRPVLLDGSDYYNYFVKGARIDIFHYLTMNQRELLISGIHPQCWDAFTGGEDD
jgi:hypothetical protein